MGLAQAEVADAGVPGDSIVAQVELDGRPGAGAIACVAKVANSFSKAARLAATAIPSCLAALRASASWISRSDGCLGASTASLAQGASEADNVSVEGEARADKDSAASASAIWDRFLLAAGAGSGEFDCGGGNGSGRLVSIFAQGDWLGAGDCLAEAACWTCSVSERLGHFVRPCLEKI